jgi:hypothetical protein
MIQAHFGIIGSMVSKEMILKIVYTRQMTDAK